MSGDMYEQLRSLDERVDTSNTDDVWHDGHAIGYESGKAAAKAKPKPVADTPFSRHSDETPPSVTERSGGRVFVSYEGSDYTVWLTREYGDVIDWTAACTFSVLVYDVAGARVLARDAAHALASSIMDGMIR